MTDLGSTGFDQLKLSDRELVREIDELSSRSMFESFLHSRGSGWYWATAADYLSWAVARKIQRTTHEGLRRLKPADLAAVELWIRQEMRWLFNDLSETITISREPVKEVWGYETEQLATLAVKYFALSVIRDNWMQHLKPLGPYRKSLYFTDRQKEHVLVMAKVMRDGVDAEVESSGEGTTAFWRKVGRRLKVGGNAVLVMFSDALGIYSKGMDWEQFRSAVFKLEKEMEAD